MANNTQKNITCPETDGCIADGELEAYIFPRPYEWLFIALYAVVFFVGITGNTLVCFAVWRNKHMRTFTNFFIVNLSVADFLVIMFCLVPSLLQTVTETWFFGHVMCKVIIYLQTISVCVSILTLSAISLERWFAICLPLKFKTTKARTVKIMISIWVISILMSIPEALSLGLVRTLPANVTDLLVSCSPTWSPQYQKIYQICLMVILYFMSGCLLAICYAHIVYVLWWNEIPGSFETRTRPMDDTVHARRRAAKMLIVLVIAFFLCYFPVHLLNILRYAKVLKGVEEDAVVAFALLSHWLCYFNSALNPVIYNFMSAKFRKQFNQSCRCFKFVHPSRAAARPRDDSYMYSTSPAHTKTEQITMAMLAHNDSERTRLTSV